MELTLVCMSLVSQFIVGITIRIDGAVKLFECHECGDKFVVSVEEGTEPLFGFDELDLGIQSVADPA